MASGAAEQPAPPRDPAEGSRRARVALARLERAQDALGALVDDVDAARELVRVAEGEPDPKLGAVADALLVARHKLQLYRQAFERAHAAALRER